MAKDHGPVWKPSGDGTFTATAPGLSQSVYRVGLVIRRDFRRLLMAEGIEFKEDRGLLDSAFIFTCSPYKAQRIWERVQPLMEADRMRWVD